MTAIQLALLRGLQEGSSLLCPDGRDAGVGVPLVIREKFPSRSGSMRGQLKYHANPQHLRAKDGRGR